MSCVRMSFEPSNDFGFRDCPAPRGFTHREGDAKQQLRWPQATQETAKPTHFQGAKNWLSDMDSNHDKGLQRALCYHYTIGQTTPNLAFKPHSRKAKVSSQNSRVKCSRR